MEFKAAPTHSDLFTNAKRRLDRAFQHIKISDEAQDSLRHPKTAVQVSIPVRMDDGSLSVFQGYRVRYDDTRGPTKGGIRYHPSVNLPEITALALQEEMKQGKDIFLLDVRNPQEYEICQIEGSHLIPLGDLMARVHELDSARDIVAHCRSGARSAKAIEMLQQAGFRKLRNLQGGILAWSRDVDPSIPAY